MKKILIIGMAACVACFDSSVADTVVGWREAASINVAEGTETVSGRITVGDGGALYKVGAGELVVPQANVDRQAPYAVTVLEGSLSIEAGSSVKNATPPDVIADKAAFWVDATNGKGLQTEDDGGTVRVTRWCDVREADPSSRTYPSALPGIVATGLDNAQTANPEVKTFGGNAAVYFGGLGSGQYMAFKNASDADLTYGKAFHFFIVHGIASTWGPVLGHAASSPSSGFSVNSYNSGFTAYTSLLAGHFNVFSGYQHDGLWTSRFSLNGSVIDAFRTSPRKGMQLLSGTVGNQFQSFSNFFRQRNSDKVIGGDYLSEAIIFTNRLSEAEIVSIERYLMAKWSLKNGTGTLVRLDEDSGRIGVAHGATVTVSPASGETTGALAFSGEGNVVKSGSGTLVIGPSGDKPPFAGSFALEGGMVAVRGGMSPALSVAGGQTLNAVYRDASDTPAKAVQAADGTDITLVSGGAAGLFRKTGAAEARVKAVASDVTKISVEGGNLVLAAPETNSLYVAGTQWSSDTGVNVYIPNAGFEEYFNDNPTSYSYSFANGTTSYNGWKGTTSNARYIRVSGGSPWTDYCTAGIPPAEGAAALLLRTSGTTAYTTVTLPQDGVYEFSCVSSACINQGTGRGVSAYYPMGIWIGAGSSLSDATQIGSIITCRTPWPRTVCRFTAAAGTYVLGFKGSGSTDDGILVDDLKLRFVGETQPQVAYAIPNGDFETYVSGTPHHLVLDANTKAEGWTFDTSESTYYNETLSKYNAAVTLASSLTYALSYVSGGTEYYTRMFPCADLVFGSTALSFIDANGKASTTFTVPAGKFRLKGRLANWATQLRSYKYNENRDATYAPVISASLTLADTTVIELGTVTTSSHLFDDVVWPVSVTFDAAEEVTLTVKQTNRGVGLLDDLVLVDAEQADSGELVVNGGFEQSSGGFTIVQPSGWYNKVSHMPYSQDCGNYGYNAYEGDNAFMLGGQCAVTWTLKIPAEGLYRLRFAAHERTSSRSTNGRNPLKATLTKSGGTAKDLILVKPFGSNFYEYSTLFSVDEAGTYTLKIQGTKTEDRRMVIDGVSVRRATAAPIPQMDGVKSISVAEGAKLHLDYPGVIKVSSFKLGGVSFRGTVNASTAPDYIMGIGSIEVEPNGIILIVE